MRSPGGRSRRRSLAVKSESSRAAGPTILRASRKESVVAHSTIMRPGRSQRLQRTAVLALTSPDATPEEMRGRAESGWRMPGVCDQARGVAAARRVAARPRVKDRRVMWGRRRDGWVIDGIITDRAGQGWNGGWTRIGIEEK